MEAESPGLVFSPFAEKVLSVPQSVLSDSGVIQDHCIVWVRKLMVMSIMLVINVVNVVMVLVPGLVFSPFAEKVLSVPQSVLSDSKPSGKELVLYTD
jgi:ribosome biogenesis protein Tsr3